MCGSKCFLVELELDGTKQIKQVTARNHIGARRVIRREYGAKVEILSLRVNRC